MPAREAIIQVVIKGRLHGSETNNVLHFDTSAQPINIPVLLAAIANCIVTTLLPALSEQFIIEKLTGKQIWPAVLDEVDYVPEDEIRGTGLPALPSFCATLFRLTTGGGGRSGKGRFFLPGVIANDVNNSIFTGGGVAKFAPFIACMVAAFLGAIDPADQKTYMLGVLSRKNAGAGYVNADDAFRYVIGISVSNVVAKMGSRKLGQGS